MAYAEIKKLREEASQNRARAKELEDRLEAAEAGAGQHSAELEALRAEMHRGEIRAAVLIEAARAGVADPLDAYQLADLSEVSVGEDGQVQGAAQAVADLVAAKPYLVVGDGTRGLSPLPSLDVPSIAPTNPGGGPALGPDDLRGLSSQTIARMDPDELRAALKNG
jgi:hypothetical protein